MGSGGNQVSRWRKLTPIALAAAAISAVLAGAWELTMGSSTFLMPMAIAAICTLLIAVPSTYCILCQNEKLLLANADLEEARKQLMAIYREMQAASHEPDVANAANRQDAAHSQDSQAPSIKPSSQGHLA